MIVGIVGKPNCGKSTFFKSATLADVEISNRPFVTIKPNSGIGYVKVECVDKEFNTQCNPRFGFCLNHIRFVPIQLIDVAGLVPGAHEGKGLGLSFLDDLREADILIHVVDMAGSTNDQGEPVDIGSYDPANDVRFLETELDMWYLQILKKGWERFARQIQQEKQEIRKALAKQLSALKVTERMIEDLLKRSNFNIDPTKWTEENLKQIAIDLRRETKPIIIAANKIDLKGASDNFARLQKEFPKIMFVPCSAEAELALREAAKKGLIEYIPGTNDFKITNEGMLSPQQKKALEFIKANVLGRFGSTGVQDVLDKAVFGLLNYIAIFPGGINKLADKEGRILPDCFLLPEGSTALDFAFKIHTDLGNRFIRAINVKKKLTIGKDYLLKHRDVIEIVSG